MMGLGSIVGTGIFVAIALAASVAGPSVILAIAMAALVAVCNALSSAQLAANHPTSGGTYEYGYICLRPWIGFSAGWMFLCAKSASAATAALGCAGYALATLVPSAESHWVTPLALAVIVAVVGIVLGGVRRSSATNVVIVSVTLAALIFFVVAGAPMALREGGERFRDFFGAEGSAAATGRGAMLRLLEATALMFVAYTGYGRIATMGEEVRDPRSTIPRAILLTLLVAMSLYLAVAAVGVGVAGAAGLHQAGADRAAPLAAVARAFEIPGGEFILSIGAVTAMLGVLLNLVLGLSRVALAMSRRGDLPPVFGRIDAAGRTPVPAVLLVGGAILVLASFGSLALAWSFSAFTVLIYYAITNLAALRLPKSQRLYHPAVAWCGLAACLGLAFWVEPAAWIGGSAVLGAGLAMRRLLRRTPSTHPTSGTPSQVSSRRSPS